MLNCSDVAIATCQTALGWLFAISVVVVVSLLARREE